MGMWSSECGNCKYWKQWGFSRNGECALNGKQRECEDSCGSFSMGRYDEDDDSSSSSDSGDSGGCFITSMLCHVLGYEDDCDIMETLRGFRDVKMKAAGCYTDILEEYDVVGPQIAQAIEKDNERKTLCAQLLDEYIAPIVQLVKQGMDQPAVDKYREMVLSLKARYAVA